MTFAHPSVFASVPSAVRRGLATAALTGLILVAAGHGALAESDPATPPLTKASGKEYVLTHASSFNAPANTHNPFWPIGWTPSAPVAAQQAAVQYDVKAENFTVTTISVDYPALAVINGKTYAVGDKIPVTADGREFVSVKKIADGVVVLDHHGRELRVMQSVGAPNRAGAK